MHCVSWFGGFMQKLGNQWALCLMLDTLQLGDVFEKANPSCVPLWNKWELCHWQHKKKTNPQTKKLGSFVFHLVLAYICMQIICSNIIVLYCRCALWGLSHLNLSGMRGRWCFFSVFHDETFRLYWLGAPEGFWLRCCHCEWESTQYFPGSDNSLDYIWPKYWGRGVTVVFICMVIFNLLNSLASSVTAVWKRVISDKCCCKRSLNVQALL